MPRRRIPSYVVVLLMVGAMPVCFVIIFLLWGMNQKIAGDRRVVRFISENQQLVAERLRNPDVHSFVLTPDPDDSATLLVRFDVADKATYELLEADLHTARHWEPDLSWRWETDIRSGEKLGNDLGAMAEGVGIAANAFVTFLLIFAASVVIPPIVVFLTRPGRSQGFSDSSDGDDSRRTTDGV